MIYISHPIYYIKGKPQSKSKSGIFERLSEIIYNTEREQTKIIKDLSEKDKIMDIVTIRNVSIKDAERILEIYAYYVKKSSHYL